MLFRSSTPQVLVKRAKSQEGYPISVFGGWVGGGAKSSTGVECGESREMMTLFGGMCLSLTMSYRQLGVQGCCSGGRET